MSTPIPVTVITGFLGAGKSTLLERWLGEFSRDEIAVIVNEEGEVGIDGSLLAHRAARLREISGGCICCASFAALVSALENFASSEPPLTRVFVECSGAASPAGVVRALTKSEARDRLRLDGIVTVVDAFRAPDRLAHSLATEQLAFADIVLLSHSDLCSPAQLDALDEQLLKLAPGAICRRAVHGKLEASRGESLLALLSHRGESLRAAPDGQRGGARHGFESVSFVHEARLDPDRFGDWVEDALGSIEARISRVKGILAMRGVEERVIVQGVGESIEISFGAPWADSTRSCRLVVIGLGLDPAELRRGFEACLVRA